MYEISHKKSHLDKYTQVKNKINELFWSGEHYIDWIDLNGKHYNYFSTDANALAIIFEIANNEKSKHIEEAAHIFEIHDVPSKCVHPNYPTKFISPLLKLIGLGDYHNGISWLWLGCISALSQNKAGKEKNAKILIKKISDLIEKHNAVYEVYEESGVPVKRFLYKSEYPFAWSAGMYVYAYNKIIKKK
jgi:hypothetical protein